MHRLLLHGPACDPFWGKPFFNPGQILVANPSSPAAIKHISKILWEEML